MCRYYNLKLSLQRLHTPAQPYSMTKKSTAKSWDTLKPPISAIKHSNYSQIPNSLHPKTMEDSTVSSLRHKISPSARKERNYHAKYH
jgi:hypothetical protein